VKPPHWASADFLREMPALGPAVALCPALAVTTSVRSALALGAVTAVALVGSDLLARPARCLLPARALFAVRLVAAAALVTLMEIGLARRAPELRASLGIYLPLAAVNCLVLTRGAASSVVEGVGLGAGLTLALGLVAIAREFVGSGAVWGRVILGGGYNPALIALAAPGAFLVLGLAAGLYRLLVPAGRGRSKP